ncbi:MAG: DNA-directed RNA polymerase subunit B, partial [Nitrososphaerales archaeon]
QNHHLGFQTKNGGGKAGILRPEGETPEGSNCGLVKNLALSAIISIDVPQEDIINKLYEMGVQSIKDASEDLKRDGCKVFVEGKFVGFVEDGNSLAKNFRELRRGGQIHPHVSIYYYVPKHPKASRRIYVNTSSGRVLRPLIVVKNGKPLLTNEHITKILTKELSWLDLLHMGVIELIDANEEENTYIAIKPNEVTERHTHLELHPAAILGVTASIIPYPEHNQSPRNTYEAAMAKQSLGFLSPTLPFNTYVRQHFMIYPQRQLVKTKASDLLNLNERPTGQNFVVAVLSFEGYNIEDAIIMNKSSIDRGLGRTFFYRLYEAESKQYLGGMKDNFEIP